MGATGSCTCLGQAGVPDGRRYDGHVLFVAPPRTLIAILLVVVGACQPAAQSTASAAGTPGLASPGVAPSGGSGPSPESASPALAGQTDTDWGRIWDTLPADFPRYPGSTPAEGAAAGPASAVLAVPGGDPRTIAGWIQSKLEQATYSTEAFSGPFEDGSYVLDSSGPAPGCRVQVSTAPLGGLTTMTVLYGASCPRP